MNEEELENECSKLQSQLLQKQRELDSLRKKTESRQTDNVLKAGNSDGKLEELTEKWTRLCQEVLLELQQKARQPTTLGQLIAYFQIEPSIVRYNEEIDGF